MTRKVPLGQTEVVQGILNRLAIVEQRTLSNPISITVGGTSTLAAGEAATVSNIGTGNALVLKFGIPQGAGAGGAGGGTSAWSGITGKPTTVAGYGITDAVTTFGQLGGKPTTLSGYGITDGQTATGSVAWTRIAGTPTTRAGYGITDAGDMLKGDNLAGLGNAATARGNLALGTLAVKSSVNDADWSGADLSIANGGTGASSASAARDALGLGTLSTQNGTFSGTSSGTNTGDQTTITGNAGSATKLATARTINGVPFDGTTNITLPTGAAITDLSQPVNFTAAADAYIPARVAMTISQGNAPIGTGTLAYAKSTAAVPSNFASTTLPATLEAGAWLKVSATAVTGFVAADLYRSA